MGTYVPISITAKTNKNPAQFGWVIYYKLPKIIPIIFTFYFPLIPHWH